MYDARIWMRTIISLIGFPPLSIQIHIIHCVTINH